MTNQKLDKLIIESQDFPEVDINKGINCWNEEFYYLLKSVFDKENNLSIAASNSARLVVGHQAKLSSNYGQEFLKKTIKGEIASYFPGNVLYLAEKKGLFSGLEFPVEIRSTQNEKIIQEGRDSVFPSITIKVYDKEFLEQAKLFAKTYTKWCGQEAKVLKEYSSTEEKAQEMIRLEGMIDNARKGKEETTNINELVEEPKVTLVRSDEAMRKLREEKQETLLKEVKQKLEQIIKPKLERGFHFGKCACDPYFSDWEYGQIKIPLTVKEHELIFKKQFAYGITVECDYIGFSNSKKVFCIELGIRSEKYLESATKLANKLKEEFDTHVKITQNY